MVKFTYKPVRSGRNWGIRCHRLVDIREEFLEHRGCKMAVEVFFCDDNVLVGRFHFHFEMLIVHVLMFHLSSPSSHLRKLQLETVDVVSQLTLRHPVLRLNAPGIEPGIS
ncbi:hypothetical protein PRIPAC_82829 [Pristionchus pacificus]|uniref:Uncharacterized protein n=1 Tax=Pristionchus pacificus TaxID=54126 RepID=A0A2A6C4V5_PRIPA|nr:hypothetical protein PRIPAC_82829 [Pristionchus pacificus]|eukprot:PDM73083.1 hypothetical protein PRIPAC_39517 [Pristionchus pacificus]